MTLRTISALTMLVLVGCGGGTTVELRANEPSVFYVDGREVGRGRFATTEMKAEGTSTVTAKADGYREKSEYLTPPYTGKRLWFTFQVSDRLDGRDSWGRTIEDKTAAGKAATTKVGAVAAPAAASEAPLPKGKPRVWVVSVGVSQFTESSIALQYADRDAQLFDEFFASSSGGSVPAERRVLLTNGQASRAAVLSTLTGIAKRTAPEDLLVIFLATHGLPDAGGDLYFLASDTDPKQLVATGLPQRDVEYALGKAPARRVALFVDACHAGGAGLSGLANRRGLVLAETNRLVSGIASASSGIALFSASSASESSVEGPQWGGGHGAFTHAVDLGLKGAADANHDGLVTIRELYDFVYTRVSESTQGQQHPEIKGTFDNGLPIAEVRGTSP